MKKLFVTYKTTKSTLDSFKKSFKEAKKGKLDDHFELSFSNEKDFNRFVTNINVLNAIKIHNPGSINELSKILLKDQGNISKLISFFEAYNVIKVLSEKNGKRISKKPTVLFDSIEFKLGA